MTGPAVPAVSAVPQPWDDYTLAPLPTPLQRVATLDQPTADARIKSTVLKRAANLMERGWVAISVKDAESGTSIVSVNSGRPRMPASNMKLITAATTLATFRPDREFRTSVRSEFPTARRVHLIGGGDPLLTSDQLAGMARRTAQQIKARARAEGRSVARFTVLVDDSRFAPPMLAVGWPAHYLPYIVSPVRALVRDGRMLMDSSIDAGRYFAAQMKAAGVPVRRVQRTAVDRTGTELLARSGNTVRDAVARMLRVSDNNIAEMLFRQVAVRRGYPATWAGARDAARAVLTGMGLDLTGVQILDGSGVSRADRLTSQFVSELLRYSLSTADPKQAAMFHPDAMPIAGRTGTLQAYNGRFTGTDSACAAGLALAKTGTLTGAIALSGVVTGADGRPKVFSFLLNGAASADQRAARRAVDAWTAAVAGCSPAPRDNSRTQRPGTAINWLEFD